MLELACFISPHGFGHATRTIAILEALQRLLPKLQARIFTSAPAEIFTTSSIDCIYHRVDTDVGLIQTDAMHADLSATTAALGRLLPFGPEVVQECAAHCLSSSLILCDISPLGISVGQETAIPTLLIENFTWDFIYRSLGAQQPELLQWAAYFSKQYRNVDYHLQTEPLCNPLPCDITCKPIARRFRAVPEQIRQDLGLSDGRKIILVSMGGMALELPFLPTLNRYRDYYFVIAGQPSESTLFDNVRLLAHDTALHHPDLIRAADLLVCKAGYSTVAECCQTDTPICCVTRDDFAESAAIASYVRYKMGGMVIDSAFFAGGGWLDMLPELLHNHRDRQAVNGADQAAAFIAARLKQVPFQAVYE